MRKINWSTVMLYTLRILFIFAATFTFLYGLYLFVRLIGKAQGWE